MEEKDNTDDDGDTFVYLDFNGKLPVDVFKKDVFIRIANLQQSNPFVQVNDSIFKGTFDHAVGTNLFFETIEDSSHSDAFEKRGPVKLNYVSINTKVINLKQVKVPPKQVKLPKKMKDIEFNLDWDYKVLLKKFEDGTLKIEDIMKHNQVDSSEDKSEEVNEQVDDKIEPVNTVNEEIEEMQIESNTDERVLDEIEPTKLLETKYEKLKVLAMKPMRIHSFPDEVEECDPRYRKAYEYSNLEHEVIKPSDFFRVEPVSEIESKTFSDYVDIDRCILYGVLAKSPAYPRIFTEEEKQKVLTLSNFDNLSLVARLYVLKKQVDDLENYINSTSESELSVEDKFGRTPLETIEIYKKLRDIVKKRLEEISSSLSFTENDAQDAGS